MKKKKVFSYLFIGLLAVGATGTVTSCKDYDDDISNLQKQITDVNAALEQCKTDCQNARNTLQQQLEAKDAELTALIQTAQQAINDNKAAIDANKGAIDANKDAIDANKGAINDNKSAIADNAAAIAANKTNIANEISRATAAEAALEARIQTCDAAIAEINQTLAGKVDKEDYNNTVRDIYAKLETVQTDLGNALTRITTNEGDIATLKQGLKDETTARVAAANDLQQQINAIKAWESRIATLESQVKQFVTSDDLNQRLSTLKSDLEDEISKLNVQSINGLEDALAAKADASTVYTKEEVANLLQEKSDEIDKKFTAEINDLNVLIKQSLRSLVFRPDLYYWGVEGTKLLTLDADVYTLPKTAWNNVEPNYNDQHQIYPSKDAFRILSFTANYHMNPSSADPNSFKNVSVISDDKDYYDDGVHTRAAACGLSVKDWSVDKTNGLLQVNLDVSNKDAIKKVASDKQITVFATQVTLAKGGNADTTITSDYATLIKDEAKDLYIFHKKGREIPYYNVNNDHCGACGVADAAAKGLGHLFKTTWEAGRDYLPQDSCNWNETLDLRKLVETHYVDVDGVERVFDADAYGLTYKFELTGLYLDGNNTSESAHAAINPADGYTFRPQMPNYDKNNVGTQQPYGYAQGRQTIGRTPLVRVSLVDKEDPSKVYAYGYIRIKITEHKDAPTPEELKALYISYTGNDYTNNWRCANYAGWSYETKWIQTEYDLYNMLNNEIGGITRTEFEKYYTPDYENAATYEFKQYGLTKAGTAKTIDNPETEQHTTFYENGTFTDKVAKVGTIITRLDASQDEDGTRTSIIRWNMTGAEAHKAFVDGNATNGIVRAVRYISHNAALPDVYVVINTGKLITAAKPSAAVDWIPAIISNYWYATNENAGQTGTDEIHAQVLTPEDAPSKKKDVSDFSDMFSDVFYGNFVNSPSLWSDMLTISNNNGEFGINQISKTFVFSKKNVGQTFKGLSGRTYTLNVSADGRTLTANGKAIAIIKGNDYKDDAVVLQETDEAKDLLNADAHDDLAGTKSGNGKALVAIIGLRVGNNCITQELDNTFNVRFLRPLNVKDNEASVQDANIVKLQEIKVVDLVRFNDWRDSWNHQSNVWGKYSDGNAEYAKYYQIKAITIDGVADGQRISVNPDVKTSLGHADVDNFDKSLSSVSDQLDFIYNAPKNNDLTTATLTYRNLSSTLSTCKVRIPVTVEYYWGKLKAYVTITVDATEHNAKRH